MTRATKFVLIALILVTCILVIARLSEYRAYFAQHNASTYVVQLFAIVIVYIAAILLAGRLKGLFWAEVFKTAMMFGLASGLMEILAIACENDLLAFGIPQFLGILGVFVTWGVAGFWAALTMKSIKAGLLTSVASAAVCMLIGVAGGVLVGIFVAPRNPAVIATWQEFKRSAWTDPAAFQIANTLDSAFGHLLLALVVAMIFGIIGAGLGRVLWTPRTRSAS